MSFDPGTLKVSPILFPARVDTFTHQDHKNWTNPSKVIHQCWETTGDHGAAHVRFRFFALRGGNLQSYAKPNM